ncbi:O-antigen ligase family protein [Halobacillus sp. A5]|uniref:O-antigen ligase family protein n=1 Tax=Halobacillus sp. A5 TaxID=2880263 RepID=UPI0020A661A3|nr:O-antigen ligase family protein [Halobacillus sp. A5]MCP3029528.1 hypothetical protein [Halobacillus sp. A5]
MLEGKNRKLLHIKDSEDMKISIALMATLVVLTFQYFILVTFNLFETSNASRVQLMSKILVGLLFLYAFPVVLKRNKIKVIIATLLALLLFALHYLLFPENHAFIESLILPFFFMCLPALFYSMSLENWNIMKSVMKVSSILIFIFGAISGFIIFSGTTAIDTYSMSISYYMLIPTLVFLNEFFDKKTFLSFIITLVSLLVILALGSRGAILCIFVFIALRLIRLDSKFSYNKVFYMILTLSAFSIIFFYKEIIVKFIYNFLLGFGIDSRTLQLFMNEELHLSGRDIIYRNLLMKISENPILGLGIGGDRALGGYAHNLFIEVFVNFGIIIGGIAIIILLLMIIKSLLTKDREKYNMLIIWINLGFVHLMVSQTYLTDIKFWVLIGLIINYLFLKSSPQEIEKYKSTEKSF